VDGDAVMMSIDPPAALVPPLPEPEGVLNAVHGIAGQDFVRVGDDLICVHGVETSATASALYSNPPYGLLVGLPPGAPPGVPGTVTLAVQAEGIAMSTFVYIDGKAILWRDGNAVKVAGTVKKVQAAKFIPPPPASTPEMDPTSEYGGSGTILQTKQTFVRVAA
jgi:hypothetical protein